MNWKPTTPVALDKLIASENIANLLSVEDVQMLGRKCQEGYENDLASRQDWERRMANANKLALQVSEQVTYPWPNASNVKFPLVTVAALQFQARAYPALVPGNELVKVRVWGDDPDGSKRERANRLSSHMSWQCLEQDPGWEEDQDKLLLVVPIAGCAFKKTAFKPDRRRIQSRLVLPKNLVVNYFTRTLDSSPRYTETYFLSANEIRMREIDGRFTDYSERYEKEQTPAPKPDVSRSENAITAATDQRQGVYRGNDDDVTPYFTGEQYCWWDLDGDGFEEPYIVVFDIGSGVVRRIVARYLPSGVQFANGDNLTQYAKQGSDKVDYDIPKDAQVYRIEAVKVYTKYSFIPSPDGGFYDLGLGQLCGPLNDSVNTLLNQMLDAGTMRTLGGGFLGRAFKGRAGPLTFAPGQWYPVDAGGDDIRKSLLPRPDPDVPPVMFQLIGFIVQYAERIVSATDIQMGESPGQNMKAETMRTLNENGQRVYSGIFKRIWRSERDEFRLRFELNALYFNDDEHFEDLTSGKDAIIRADDYAGSSLTVRPAADPHVVSDSEAERQATMLVQLAASQPGYNRYQCNRRLLKALKVPAMDEVYPPPKDPKTGQPLPDYPPPVNPKLIEAQAKIAKQQMDQKLAQASLLIEAKESESRIHKLQAEALKITAEAKGANVEPLIKLIYADIESENKRHDRLLKLVEMVADAMKESSDGTTGAGAGAGQDQGGGAGVAALAGAAVQPAAHPMAGGNGQVLPGMLG